MPIPFGAGDPDAMADQIVRTKLADCLQRILLLKGACRRSDPDDCGACTVRVERVSVRSGLPNAIAQGNDQAFVTGGVTPGAFCLPARETPNAQGGRRKKTYQELLQQTLSGGQCLCTGYAPFVEAAFQARKTHRLSQDHRS